MENSRELSRSRRRLLSLGVDVGADSALDKPWERTERADLELRRDEADGIAEPRLIQVMCTGGEKAVHFCVQISFRVEAHFAVDTSPLLEA